MIEPLIIFPSAILIDVIFGEPINRFHPVAWLGELISLELKITPKYSKIWQFIYGMVINVSTTSIIVFLSICVLNLTHHFNIILYYIISIILLKFTLSIKALYRASEVIRHNLSKNDLEKSKAHLTALVSRDTKNLNKEQIISATVESLAENTNDSIVAPVFYYLLFGIPGAVAYRIINTFDAMIGYKDKFEYTGKFSAKLDDIANFIPARISALLIIIAAWLCKYNYKKAWQILIRDHGKTQSPNAGWPMSAMAGAIDIQLEKLDHYKLGDENQRLSITNIQDSQKIVLMVSLIMVLICISVKGALIVTA